MKKWFIPLGISLLVLAGCEESYQKADAPDKEISSVTIKKISEDKKEQLAEALKEFNYDEMHIVATTKEGMFDTKTTIQTRLEEGTFTEFFYEFEKGKELQRYYANVNDGFIRSYNVGTGLLTESMLTDEEKQYLITNETVSQYMVVMQWLYDEMQTFMEGEFSAHQQGDEYILKTTDGEKELHFTSKLEIESYKTNRVQVSFKPLLQKDELKALVDLSEK